MLGSMLGWGRVTVRAMLKQTQLVLPTVGPAEEVKSLWICCCPGLQHWHVWLPVPRVHQMRCAVLYNWHGVAASHGAVCW